MECKNASLCLFDEQDVQTDIIGNNIVDYHPITSLSAGGPIEFYVSGTTDEYIDCGDINLLVNVKITKPDGSNIDSTKDKVCLVNQGISSIFQDVFLSIGDTQVEGGQHCYPYNGYLSSLLQFHPSAKKTHMQSWGWNEDEPGKFDLVTNKGAIFRMNAIEDSKECQLYGPLFLDMTRQSRFVLPQTNLRFKLLPAKPEFALQTFGTTDKYIYKITKCVLHVRRIKVNDSVIDGHVKGLETNNAKYNVNHVSISSFTINDGTQTHIKDRLFLSQTPKLLVVGLLEHDRFNGTLSKSPFDFQNFGLNKLGLYRDGELSLGQTFTPDFANDCFLRSYVNTMSALNFFNSDDSNGMTIEHFKNGYNLYVFDLTPDANAQAPYRSPKSSSSLRLEFGFETVLKQTINIVLFAVFDSKLEITKYRDVVMNYSR